METWKVTVWKNYPWWSYLKSKEQYVIFHKFWASQNIGNPLSTQQIVPGNYTMKEEIWHFKIVTKWKWIQLFTPWRWSHPSSCSTCWDNILLWRDVQNVTFYVSSKFICLDGGLVLSMETWKVTVWKNYPRWSYLKSKTRYNLSFSISFEHPNIYGIQCLHNKLFQAITLWRRNRTPLKLSQNVNENNFLYPGVGVILLAAPVAEIMYICGEKSNTSWKVIAKVLKGLVIILSFQIDWGVMVIVNNSVYPTNCYRQLHHERRLLQL